MLFLVLNTPVFAFVNKINPAGGPIPCHQFKAVLVEFIYGTFTGGQLATALQNHYGFTFNAVDQNDNSALIGLINAQSTTAEKVLVALHFESLCAAWEEGFAVVDTPNEFRTLLGIPAQ